jgi:uridylate kinase
MKKTIVLSLGGSIINPGEIQIPFLKGFKEFVLGLLKQNYRLVIVSGGGKICRQYQQAADEITPLTDEDKDWLGIHTTRLNAHLLRSIFKQQAYPVVLDDPKKQTPNKYNLFIASGWRPGRSTDYIAVLLAKRFKTTKVINASNVEYVYDKDPAKFKDAKPLKEISWPDYLKIAGKKWIPGMNVPFDPIASRIAQKERMTIIFAKGTDLSNLKNIIEDKPFKGTVIRP